MPSLPAELLADRVRREIADARRTCPHYVGRAPDTLAFPLRLQVALLNTPGPVWDGSQLHDSFVHRLEVTIDAEYPYVKPGVKWLTPIFHPNIMMPEEGGLVCTKLLKGWRFDSTLALYLDQLAKLVTQPDTKNAFATPASAAAAQYFAKSPYAPPRLG